MKLFPRLSILALQSGTDGNSSGGSLISPILPATIVFCRRRVPPALATPPVIRKPAPLTPFSRIVVLVIVVRPPNPFHTPPPSPARFFAIVLFVISARPPTLAMPPP